MKFAEILTHLIAGKKIRRSDWDEGEYMSISNGIVLNELKEEIHIAYLDGEDWELFKEKELSDSEKLQNSIRRIEDEEITIRYLINKMNKLEDDVIKVEEDITILKIQNVLVKEKLTK